MFFFSAICKIGANNICTGENLSENQDLLQTLAEVSDVARRILKQFGKKLQKPITE